jgi:hypothetical protein
VLRVTLNVPTPFSSVALAGNTAAPSLLVKCTVPVYEATVVLLASSAVTVTEKPNPLRASAGAVTLKCVAESFTCCVTEPLLPPYGSPLVEPLNVAFTVSLPAVSAAVVRVACPFDTVETAHPVFTLHVTVPATAVPNAGVTVAVRVTGAFKLDGLLPEPTVVIVVTPFQFATRLETFTVPMPVA